MLLNKQQKILLNFQKKRVVESVNEDDLSSEDIEKNYHLMAESQNPMDRLFAVAKTNGILKAYLHKKKLGNMDLTLMKGIFYRSTQYEKFMLRGMPGSAVEYSVADPNAARR